MKIIKVNIPKSDPYDGLEQIRMDKLDSVVLITGKNGSGKTRILNRIFDTLKLKPTKKRVEKINEDISKLKDAIKSYENNIDSLRRSNKRLNNKEKGEPNEKFITSSEAKIEEIEEQLYNLQNELSWSYIETNELSDSNKGIPFVPKSLALADSSSYSKIQIIDSAKKTEILGVDKLPDSVFAKIQLIQDNWFNSTHPLFENEFVQKNAIENYNNLNSIISLFLNTKLSRDSNGDATIFGFPLGKSNLSNGQKILLQFCLAIYSQEIDLRDIILIMDEPENHLHPSIIIETIEQIIKCVPNGQLWIATHSIPLLAHFNPNCIWYVDEGKIVHAGKITEKVLSSLLGSDDEVEKLQDFIGLQSQFSTSRYAYESLIEPLSIRTTYDDPQSKQIRQELESEINNKPIRILDYGIGKGRLISNFVDLDEQNLTKVIEKIDYVGYDIFNDDKEECLKSIIYAYGNCNKRYYNDYSKLITDYDKNSFDIVIMCNVLHEIDPTNWIKLFQQNGVISSLLKNDSGYLLLIEDHLMPIGEKAYQNGFLVMDTLQLKELFKITENDSDFSYSDLKGDGRLKAHKIPKKYLERINDISRINAIKSLSVTAKEKIIEVRSKEKSYKNGRIHGFWTQQFSNSQLILSELTVN